MLITLRLTSPQDRKAVDAWVSAHGTPAQRDAMLASLPLAFLSLETRGSTPAGHGVTCRPGRCRMSSFRLATSPY